MYTEDIFEITNEVTSRLQEACENEFSVDEIRALMSDSKRALFGLCDKIDEEGIEDNEDAEGGEIADMLTEILDMMEDLLGAIDDDEVDAGDCYDEIDAMLETLNALAE